MTAHHQKPTRRTDPPFPGLLQVRRRRRGRPPPPGALFNFGVALTDLARTGDPSAKPARLRAAAAKYRAAAGEDPANVQALNNLGLILADLGQSAAPAERAAALAAADTSKP